MGDDSKKKEDDEDDRLEFLLNYLTKSYRLKQEKWNKMIAIDENKVSGFGHQFSIQIQIVDILEMLAAIV